MSRIVNETGRYEPQAPAVPVSVEVDVSELPQIKPDVYAEVDHRDFSTAVSMSRVQQLTMAQIAASRGDTDTAMRWKQHAHQRVLAEERASEAQRMAEMLVPAAPVHHGGPLTEIKSDVPWENDPAYVELARERQTLTVKLEAKRHEGSEFDDDYFALSGKISVLDDKLATRKTELVETGRAAGTWTEANERTLEARATLQGKASQVAGMFPGHDPAPAPSVAGGEGSTE